MERMYIEQAWHQSGKIVLVKPPYTEFSPLGDMLWASKSSLLDCRKKTCIGLLSAKACLEDPTLVEVLSMCRTWSSVACYNFLEGRNT